MPREPEELLARLRNRLDAGTSRHGTIREPQVMIHPEAIRLGERIAGRR